MKKWLFLLLVLVFPFTLWADHSALRNDTFNTLPDSNTSTFRTNSQIFWDHETAQREGRHGGPFTASGGLHTTSASFTSLAFATEAFVPERINQVATAITYSALPADVCWTIISSDNNGIVGWTRVGSTAYYYMCEGNTTPTEPTLPPNSAWLMGPITITGSAIVAVTDKRTPLSFILAGVYNVMDPLFGAVADGVTDDYGAIQAAINALPAPSGGIVQLPCGRNLRMNTGLIWSIKVVWLRGCTAGLQPGTGTRITAAAGITAITFQNGTGGYGARSKISNLRLIGSDAAAGANDGILVQANSWFLEDLWVEGFAGYGVHVASGAGAVSTNANHGLGSHVSAYQNKTGGIKLDGVNSNANTFIMTNAINNGTAGAGYGVYDNAFLGNYYFGMHFSGNAQGPIRIGDVNRSMRMYGIYVEDENKPCLTMDAGGAAGNVIDFAICSRPDGADPIVDNTASGNNFITFYQGGIHQTRFVVGGILATLPHLLMTPTQLQFNEGASARFQDDGISSNWTIQNVLTNLSFTGAGTSRVLMTQLKVDMPAQQVLVAGSTILDNGCTTIKRISSASAITTSTTNTFTAPDSSNAGCVMHVCNTGGFTITLDRNAAYLGQGGADTVLIAPQCVTVGSTGSIWYQIGAQTP